MNTPYGSAAVPAAEAFAVLAAGYAAAWWLTAENPFAAWHDEWQLNGADLAALDRACQANPRSSGIVVTLTSIPSRVDGLALTLKSLLRQTLRPVEIRLCLPAWSRRENRAYAIPPWIRALRSVVVIACEDAGPATKFLPTLSAVAPDQPVLVVDDDRVYHPRLLEAFTRLAAAHPDFVVSASGWSAPADLVDRPTTLGARLAGAAHVPVLANRILRPRRVDIVQGLHGYLVRPRFFDLGALADFSAAPPALRYVDDVWISAHCRVERMVFPVRLSFIDYKPWSRRRLYNRTSLGGNVNRAPTDEQRGNSVALRYFRDRWRK